MNTNPTFNYDEASDTLYVSFVAEQKGTGIELTDHILLRLDKSKKQALGLTILDYSLLVQETEMGRRQFPLTGLADLAIDKQIWLLSSLRSEPINQILDLSAYTPNLANTTPIVSVHPVLISA